MAKRKRPAASNGETAPDNSTSKKVKAAETPRTNGSEPKSKHVEETIQVVVGSYDRVLHGLSATVGEKAVEFADTFLFNAHSSMIRCVAVSPASKPNPGEAQKVFLASGSTDERINIYELSAHPAKKSDQMPHVAPRPILENPRNRERGTLLHHESTVTALHFPSRSKLVSSSDDLTIATTRTRDWQLVSSMKSTKPKAQGRPSGDTAPFGGTPAGVNDFAIHPSMKVVISVNKGERCMRLWDFVRGKKSGVLDLDRSLLQEVGEGRHSTGEGRRIAWGNVGGEDEFAVGFDRDVAVFGTDCQPKCRLMATKTKVHQLRYVLLGGSDSSSSAEDENGSDVSLLAVSTEDGRIIFHSTASEHISEPTADADAEDASRPGRRAVTQPTLGIAKTVAVLGGKDAGVSGRIKDFICIRSAANERVLYVVTGSSDGMIRLWSVDVDELQKAADSKSEGTGKQIGRLAGEYKTHDRVTCLTAFLMIPRSEGLEDDEEEVEEEEEEGEETSDEEDEE